ncbi:hypothetical protein OAI86_00340 [Alphaproteobacteria bacterium]|nr:hypothetical protein [Alphaproteobacteria bacterium]
MSGKARPSPLFILHIEKKLMIYTNQDLNSNYGSIRNGNVIIRHGSFDV